MRKNCIKCSIQIPATLLVDGKRRNLCNRVLCINCSPFGSKCGVGWKLAYNIASNIGIDNNGFRKCVECNRKYLYSKKKGHTGTRCNSCKTSRKRNGKKARAILYMGGKCILCGYNKCVSAMVFHHINPLNKEFGIGQATYLSWIRIKREIDKCVLLCHNCHSEVHEGLTNLPSSYNGSIYKA